MGMARLEPGDVIRTASCAEYVYLGRYRNRARQPLAGPRGKVLPEGWLYAETLGGGQETMDALLSPDAGLCTAVLTARPKAFEAVSGRIPLEPYGPLDDIQGLERIDRKQKG